MKSFFASVIFCLLLFCLITPSSYGQIEMVKLEDFLQQQITEERFSGVVLLAEDGKIISQRGIGWADRSNLTPMDLSTKFRIASITKSFTALLIMQLVDDGLLTLDQSIADLLPELDLKRVAKVKVYNLLNHTSGLKNEPDEIYAEKLSTQEIINRLIAGKKVKQAVNKSFNYNNVDYLLLGLIIEKLRGMPWREVVQMRILGPLDMKETGFLEKDNLPVGLAKGYLCENKICLEEPAYFIENFHAAGAMFSTATDLLKWDQGLYGEKLISAKSKAIMYTSDPKLGYVAYGSWTFKHPFVNGQPFTVERRGGILGFNSVIMRFPEAKKTLIILSNTNQFNPDTFGDSENLKEQLVKLLFSD